MTPTQFNQLTERMYNVLLSNPRYTLEEFRSATRVELREIGVTVDVNLEWKLYRSEADEYVDYQAKDFDDAFFEAEVRQHDHPKDAPDEIHCFEDGILVRRYEAQTGGLL